MAQCKHHEVCGREATSRDDCCILHTEDSEKDAEAFEEALDEHRDQKGDDFRYMVFPQFVFEGVTFREADFSEATFKGRVDFRSTTFEGQANFARTTFVKNVTFSGGTFTGLADFTGTVFGGAYFMRAIFEGEVTFTGAIFKGRANFKEAIFRGIAHLRDTTFERTADFTEVTFQGVAVHEGGALFTSATFKGRTDFSLTTFKGRANFKEATFKGQVNFKSTTFEGRGGNRKGEVTATSKADFAGAVFEGHANFEKARFVRQAGFPGAAFEEKARFISATFEGPVTFEKATFDGDPTFSLATFESRANFSYVTFKNDVYFSTTTFEGAADFTRAAFEGYANFSRTAFKEIAIFRGAAFRERALFEDKLSATTSGSSTPAHFHGVVLDPLDALSFRNTDLGRCRLLGTDVREIEFTGVRWAQGPNRRWGLWEIGGNYVYDELYHEEQRREDSKHRMPWSALERLYRELKQNYEDRHDYARAGDFHYREKEMRRRNPRTPGSHKALLWAYWLLSGYGERVWPALLWFLFIIALSAFLYLQIGIAPADGGAPLRWGLQYTGSWRGLGEALVYSARTSFLLSPEDFELTSVGAKIVNLVQTVISPIILGLMALAIRQRLKR